MKELKEIITQAYEIGQKLAKAIELSWSGKSLRDMEEITHEIGRAFEGGFLQAKVEEIGKGYKGAMIWCECGGRAEYEGDRKKKVKTLWAGDIEVKRAYYLCEQCHQGIVPLDEELGLFRDSLSPKLREGICLSGALSPFGKGRDLLKRLSGRDVSEVEIMKVSEREGNTIGVGQAVRGKYTLENFTEAEEEGIEERGCKRRYIQIDGGMVNTRQEGWKEVKLGCIFDEEAIAEVSEGRREILQKRYFGCIGSVEEFEPLMWSNVSKIVSEEDEIIVMGDGARWIWNLVSMHFPYAVEIIDFYHVKQHLWEVGKEIFGEGTEQCKEWIEDKEQKLLQGDIEYVMRSLKELSMRLGQKEREEVEKLYNYFEENKSRMRYAEFRQKGYYIGTGAIEGAIRHVIGDRLKLSGMKWNKEGANSILNLRFLYLNGDWDAYWKQLSKKLPTNF